MQKISMLLNNIAKDEHNPPPASLFLSVKDQYICLVALPANVLHSRLSETAHMNHGGHFDLNSSC